ncbi:MAG: MFS transporter [Nitrososphaerota archaeon]|nr:MFS transporter [Nitrososphaerota archaeon]
MFCGLSTSAWELAAFRILQGVGGALISSNSGAIIADTFERSERGKAYGIIGIGFIVGAALGILVGGIFTTFFSWRYIFFINLPVGTVGTILGYLKLKERSPKMRANFDLVGMNLFGAGLSLVLYALTEIAGSGFTFLYSSLLLSGGLVLVCFALWETYYSQPLIPMSVLRQRILSASILASFFQYVAFYAVMFLMIMYLQGPRGLTPFNVSLLYIPAYVLSGCISPYAGRGFQTSSGRDT